MEDILASIRRIIADDQSQGTRATYTSEPDPAPSVAPSVALVHDEAVANVSTQDRTLAAAEPQYEEVLDLASVESATFAQEALPNYEEPTLVASAAEPVVLPEPELETVASAHLGQNLVAEREAAVPEQRPNERRNGQFAPPRFRPSRTEPSFSQDDTVPTPPSSEASVPGESEPQATVSASDGEGDSLISPMLGASVMSAFETLAATVMLQNTEMLERIMRELLRPLVKGWLDENLPTLVERLVRGEIERVARGGRG